MSRAPATPHGAPSDSPHALILASAGSGKTHRLTTRFLALVARGAPPGRILATTFTRKAAGEILERVLARLASAADDDKTLARLNSELESEGAGATLTRESAAIALASLARGAHRLSVQTIDSFFHRAASAFSLELGAPPGWRITDEVEADALMTLAADEALADAPFDELRELFRLHAGGAARSVHATLVKLGKSALPLWLATKERPGAWEVIDDAPTPLSAAEVEQALARLRIAPLAQTGGKKGAARDNGHWVKARANAVDCVERALAADNWDEVIEEKFICVSLAENPAYHGHPYPAETLDVCRALAHHARARVLRAFIDQSLATRDLTARLSDALDRVKRSRGAFGFDDIPRMLLGAGEDRLDDLYYRLDGRIDHILLDEFQDTSVAQFRLLRPMLDELCAQDEGGRSVLVVGDVKQSLYGWREAEPELLRRLDARYPTLRRETLATSRRSSQVVLDAVNDVFASLPRLDCLRDAGDATERWGEGFERHTEWTDAKNPSKPGVVRLWVAPEADAGPPDADGKTPRTSANAQMLETLTFAAQRIRALLDSASVSGGASGSGGEGATPTVGVLFRARKHIPRMIDLLRARGVRASEEGGNPLTDAPAVAACLSLLHAIDHPGDTAALFHAATSPLGAAAGLTDPFSPHAAAGSLAPLRERVHREGVAPSLRTLLAACAASLDARSMRRFEQLINLAQRFDASPWSRIDEFIRLVRRTGVEEASADAVRVMTIHAAKGLEFDAVVLPDLARPWAPKTGQPLLFREGDDPLAPPSVACFMPRKALREAHPALAAITARAVSREVEAELSALYVAMTRAALALEMIVPPNAVKPADPSKPPKPSAARALREALAPDASATPGSLVCERGDGDALAKGLAARARAAQRGAGEAIVAAGGAPEPIRPAFAPARGGGLRRSRIASPSSLRASPLVDLAEVLRGAGSDARRRGELTHVMFERVGWLDETPPDERACRAAAVALGASESETEEALRGFRAACAREAIREALSRGATARRAPTGAALSLRREWEFVVRDAAPGEAPTLLRGRFDRVAIATLGGAPVWAEVVDFKTGAAPARTGAGEGNGAGGAGAYAEQMRAYRRAAAGMLRIPLERIGARLVFVDEGIVLDAAG